MSSFFYIGFCSSITNGNGNVESSTMTYKNDNGNEEGFISETKNKKTIETLFRGPETLFHLKQRKPKKYIQN